MIRPISVACLLMAVFAILVQVSAADTPDRFDYLLAGSEESLWLVRSRPTDGNYDIVARPVDHEWKWVTEGVQGLPAAATVTGRSLHVIFTNPTGYLVYDLSGRPPTGRDPSDPRWPEDADHLAICPAGDFGVSGASSSAVLAVVARPSDPTAETGADAPNTTLGVFSKAGAEWRHLSDCPSAVSLADDRKILSTVADGSLYVLVAGEGINGSEAFILTGMDWKELPLSDWPAHARAIGLVSMANRPVFVLSSGDGEHVEEASGQVNLELATYNPASGSFTIQPLLKEGKTASWDAASIPLPCRFSDGIAFIWGKGDALMFARCGLNGELSSPASVDVFTRSLEDLRGKDVMDIFTWSLLGIFVAMFLTRPPGASQPFVLPATMRPGNPFKRVLAAFIDLVPCSAISFAVFRPDGLASSPQELLDYLKDFEQTQLMPTNMAYFIVSSSLLYVAYGTIMEHRFQATLGKMLLSLRVVGQAGTRPCWRTALLRNMVKIIEMSWPVVVLPFALMLFTRNRQRMGDFVARTTVIDKRYAPPPELIEAPPASDGDHPGARADEDPQDRRFDGDPWNS